jgi:hypothetical protein
MDVFVFQKLEEKTYARGQRASGSGETKGNVLDLESLNPEEIKLALITDVDRLVRTSSTRSGSSSTGMANAHNCAL